MLIETPETLPHFLYEEDESDEEELNIDKTWHAIHFLLTGDPWQGYPPLVNAVLGGAPISQEDIGYGPVRYLTKEAVKQVSDALSTISPDDLWKRFDPEAFLAHQIYPGFTGNAEDKIYICSYFQDLKTFFREAAANDLAMILYMD